MTLKQTCSFTDCSKDAVGHLCVKREVEGGGEEILEKPLCVPHLFLLGAYLKHLKQFKEVKDES